VTEHTKGTGKWRQPGIPHKGWTCVDIEDAEDEGFICEMCEVQEIRYVHEMEHPEYAETLRCGCICAGYMEQDPTAAYAREARFKNLMARRARWLARDWRVSGNGNDFLNTQDGFHIVVYPIGDIWGARFTDKRTGYSRASKRPYADEAAAKLATFDAIAAYKARGR
jgi:hypothetical protein